MTRFKRQPKPLIYAALAVSMVLVFVGDLYSPLGYATWAFYLIPVVLAYLLWRPEGPVVAAAFATALTIAGYLLSPARLHVAVGRANRVFCLITLWTLAVIGRQFVLNKLMVRKQEWLQAGQTRLSQQMVGDRQLAALGEDILRFLANYLQAQAGAIFIDQDGRFRRFATYGVPH